VFLNSHLLGEVEATCDRVAFVKQGRTVHERLLASDAADVDVTIRLGGAPGDLAAGLAALGTHVVQENGRVRMRVSGDHALPAIARWLAERRVDVYEIRTERQSLEALFLEVMGGDQRPG
jgi:ABC-2 type transport system ATP-binding protein